MTGSSDGPQLSAVIEHPQEVLLVIVGAGASFDCLQSDRGKSTVVRALGTSREWSDVRPPLTQDLVGPGTVVRDLALRYPFSQPVIDELRERLLVLPGRPGNRADNLEVALREYLDRSRENPVASKHLASFRFFLRDYLWLSSDYVLTTEPTTNYTRLVRHLYDWAVANHSHVCFISFNYDTLLDQACANHWGLDIEDPGTYIADDFASLLKPHGSVRWAWRDPNTAPVGTSAEAAAARIARGEPDDPTAWTIITGQFPGHSETPQNRALHPDLPALALPVDGKTGFILPSGHQAFLDELQGRVRRLLTIGWRAAEPDFVEVLSRLVMSRNRSLFVVGGPAATADFGGIINNFGDLWRRLESPQKLEEGFRPIFENGLFDWLLKDITWPPP